MSIAGQSEEVTMIASLVHLVIYLIVVGLVI
jgi:hypothetical protein